MNFPPPRLPLILMWLLLLLIPTSLQADNWPCFRGLNHDGISKEKILKLSRNVRNLRRLRDKIIFYKEIYKIHILLLVKLNLFK